TKLSSLRGKWTLLVFADRRGQIAPLRGINPQLASLGAQLVGVCHEKPQALKSLVEKDSLRCVLLADATGQVSAMYGLYDPVHSDAGPGLMILDPGGYLRIALLGKLFPADDILNLARFIITGP